MPAEFSESGPGGSSRSRARSLAASAMRRAESRWQRPTYGSKPRNDSHNPPLVCHWGTIPPRNGTSPSDIRTLSAGSRSLWPIIVSRSKNVGVVFGFRRGLKSRRSDAIRDKPGGNLREFSDFADLAQRGPVSPIERIDRVET